MSSSDVNPNAGWHQYLAGRVLNTAGVVFLSIAMAIAATAWDGVSANVRTMGGLAIAVLIGLLGERLSRAGREDKWWGNSWFTTTTLSCAYALAYFFAYATHYVPGLNSMETPYAAWGIGLVLAGVGAYHGTKNERMRWFTSAFTLLVTGHALFHAFTSDVVFHVAGYDVKLGAFACVIGLVWCGWLSRFYKKSEMAFPDWAKADNFKDYANGALYRVSHEVYFFGAAGCAMGLPFFLATFSDAPFWWAIEAPVLLGLSWRNGNAIKHGVCGVIWLAAAGLLLKSNFGENFPLYTVFAVVGGGSVMAMCYRYLESKIDDLVKVNAYRGYLYAAVAVALAVPYLQLGYWNSMPYWMVEALVICGAGLALRDGLLHKIGWLAAIGATALFFAHFTTWTWTLVGPVVALAYGLSVAYSQIHLKGGWKESEFITGKQDENNPIYAITADGAERLENIWSWIGFGTIVVASYVLIADQMSVIAWACEAMVLFVLGFAAHRLGYRLQGLVAIGGAAAKLVFWDVSHLTFAFEPTLLVTLFRALEFAVVGAVATTASFLYFREELRLKAAAAGPAPTDSAPPTDTTAAPAFKADDKKPGDGEGDDTDRS